MARINVENEFWDDPRFKNLKKLFALEVQLAPYAEYIAVGMMICLWKLAQHHVTEVGAFIPADQFENIEANPKLIEAKLVTLKQDGYFVEGSKKHLRWLAKRRKSGGNGGRVKSEKKAKNLAQNRSKPEANESKPEASYSTSYSSSFSSSNSLNSEKENILNSGVGNSNPGQTPVDAGKFENLIEAWRETLLHFQITLDPQFDEVQIQNLRRRYGFERTKLALIGMRFEPKHDGFDPADYCTVSRLSKKDHFEKCEKWASKDRSQKSSTDWVPPEMRGK